MLDLFVTIFCLKMRNKFNEKNGTRIIINLGYFFKRSETTVSVEPFNNYKLKVLQNRTTTYIKGIPNHKPIQKTLKNRMIAVNNEKIKQYLTIEENFEQ